MVLSVLVALILTPALCATLLKPVSAEHHENKGRFFGWFNTTFDHSVNHYTNSVGKIIGSTYDILLIYALIVAGMVVFVFDVFRLLSYLKRIRRVFSDHDSVTRWRDARADAKSVGSSDGLLSEERESER
ncbi:efflux RND transporter permease subunit [Shigella flexneri]